MDEPDFLICLNCETPCYVFEYKDDKLKEAFCTACGADETDNFMTQEEFEALASG